MTQFAINAQDTETASQHAEIRRVELSGQRWDRNKTIGRAKNEGIELSDEHWEVIDYLRTRYLEHGLAVSARMLSGMLNQQFSVQGGSRYLYRLFPGGPVKQGSRLADLRTPANVADISFGSGY
jgi:TusE/DsrC/DsvC family sulfur relay protein